MPRTLIAEEFNGAKLGKVQGFDCGQQPWAKFATSWIQAPADKPGALKSIATRGTKVWLYFDLETDQLVGFGSLGQTTWPSYTEPVSIIPQIAIQTAFQGQPAGAGETKFSHQMLDDLIARAKLSKSRQLVLTVDPANVHARRLYSNYAFVELTDRSALGHIKMSLLLGESV